jgi:hypothetical protein
MIGLLQFAIQIIRKTKNMSTQEKADKSWGKEKEDLKLKFELITNKYSMFEGSVPGTVSEKLRLRFAKTKKELRDIIAAL